MIRERDLPYPVGALVLDASGHGTWWLVYDQSEGFCPMLVAVRCDDPDDAAELWEQEPRNSGRDSDQLVVVALDRSGAHHPDCDGLVFHDVTVAHTRVGRGMWQAHCRTCGWQSPLVGPDAKNETASHQPDPVLCDGRCLQWS